ncbi:ABC transporter permease/M1 family aminopeptidase [Steroidobacter flavus]|uniref:ABC transporter permease/M1 family aminopeptidase n=1 Tax=Steroidobacter flavus TaxID=1842136 RepID=A0ABV8STM3_9GAMM
MFSEFFRFELRYQLRSPLPWVIGLMFALMAFAATTTDVITIGEGIGNANRNAPYVILTFLKVFSTLGMFVAVALIAQPLLRDFELGTEELFFSKPLNKATYLWGRFAAGSFMALIVMTITALGMILGSFMPWIDPQRLGPFSPAPYLWGFGVMIIPNLLFTGALLGLLAVTTRRLLLVFVGVVAFIALWSIAGALTRDIQYHTISALIDPLGGEAISQVMRYWSVVERNTLLPELSGLVLLNRLIWAGVAIVMLVATQLLFKPQRQRAKKHWWQRSAQSEEVSVAAPARRGEVPASVPARPVARALAAPHDFDASAAFGQFTHLVWFDTKSVLRSIPFLVLLAFGLFNYLGGSPAMENTFGTSVYPVTALMMQYMQGSYQFLLVIIVSFYAGDVLWRERDAKLAEVTDSLPVPNWVPLLSKLGAVTAVVFAFIVFGVMAAIGYQLWHGYTRLEPLLYLQAAFIDSWPFVLMGALALFLQIISNHKFLGYLLLILAMLAQIVLSQIGYEHNLYNYAGAPQMTYSDMNGYGHLLKPWAWFQTYWTLFAAILIVLANAFWVRGTASRWSLRWREALRSLRGPQAVALASLALAFIVTGGWIFYNTNILNEYVPEDVAFDRQARLEKDYRQFKDLPQPRVVDVRADVDIYPEERRSVIRGHYHLINKHDVAIPELHVYTNPLARIEVVAPAGVVMKKEDREAGMRIFALREPLAPGAALDFDFIVERAERGFTNSGMPRSTGGGDLRSTLNANGTFFTSNEMPHFGYDESRQLLDRNERRKRGLGDVPRKPKLEDEQARYNIGIVDSDWINFEATVSTSADQIALAPGYLQREWTENGRRYFHYKMDRPMLPFYCFLSARWDVKRGEWHGLPIEIYHDPKHAYNVDRMIDATRKSLDYFTTQFSPYQSKQVRILEFPRYAKFAQSFANTIPFSESIGFIANLTDPESIDYVFYVTAHEMAHQWWGHQVVGADVQGQTMLMESMSQYSALMVMEKEYGREHMRRFLKYELDRYLRGRGGELIEELPLMRVEDQQYIHYAKGSLVLYRLRDEIGEENLNRALANYIRDKAYQQPPYTTTLELVDYIRAQTTADKYPLIDELLAKIIFYDNRVVSASVTPRNGKYDVTIEYGAAKRESDGAGRETQVALDDWIEVGVFARAAGKGEHTEKPLYLERKRITQSSGKFTMTVDAMPYEVGFDPYNKLIDRLPDDNRKTVEIRAAAPATNDAPSKT